MTWQRNVTFVVEIASDGGPFTDSPTWQTVTTDAVHVTCQRGRSERLSTFSTGSATLRMKSLTRKYDPDYASRLTGFQLGRQVRVRATPASTYEVFRGHIDSIKIPYTHRSDIVEIGCLDLLSELAQLNLEDTAHAVTMRSFTPSVWWRLDETGLDASGNGNDATVLLTSGSYVDPLEASGTGKAIKGAFSITNSRPLSGGASNQRSVSFLVQAAVPVSSYFDALFVSANGDTSLVQVAIDGAGTVTATIGAANLTATRPVFDGRPHHVLAVRDGVNAYLYIDGVLNASSAGAGASTPTLTTFEAYAAYDIGAGSLILDEMAVLEWAVDASSALTLASGALTGWVGDRSDDRIARIATLIGIPAGRQSLEAGSSGCGAFQGSTDVASYFQKVAAGEDGRLFVAGDGKLTFLARTHDVATSVTAGFLDSAAGVRFLSLTNQQSRQKVLTRAEVGGVDVFGRYIDSTAELSYGARRLSIDTALSNGASCMSLATHLVTENNTPTTRPGQWTASIGRNAGDVSTLLSLEIGRQASISRTPMGIAPAVAANVTVEQVAHDIDPSKDWKITYSAVPVDTTPLFRWGTSNWGGAQEWSYG